MCTTLLYKSVALEHEETAVVEAEGIPKHK